MPLLSRGGTGIRSGFVRRKTCKETTSLLAGVPSGTIRLPFHPLALALALSNRFEISRVSRISRREFSSTRVSETRRIQGRDPWRAAVLREETETCSTSTAPLLVPLDSDFSRSAPPRCFFGERCQRVWRSRPQLPVNSRGLIGWSLCVTRILGRNAHAFEEPPIAG